MLGFFRVLYGHSEMLALLVLLLGVLAGRWSLHRTPATRFVTRVPIFLIFTYLLIQARLVPYLPTVQSADAISQILGDGLRTVWWFWAASIGSNALNLFSFRGSLPAGHKFFTDLCGAVIHIFAFFGFISFVLNFPIQGILVTSGAVAVVLGLALQSSLGDVFYGVVLNLGKPFKEGNWISLDNGIEGRVLEMNWRATHLLTSSQDVLIIPNSLVGKSRITNLSLPSNVHGTKVSILLSPNTFPMMGCRLITDAIHGCSLVLSTPPPIIIIQSMSQEAIAVEIIFFTSRIEESDSARNQVFEKIYRCLGAMGIGLGSLTTALGSLASETLLPSTGAVERLVAFTPIFSHLPASERSTIAAAMVRETFENGKTVVDNGIVSEAMYVVASGVLSYTRTIEGRAVEIARMGMADYFGAGGLLKAAPTVGKVSALTHVVVYRLDKKDFLRLVKDRPELSFSLGRELATRESQAGTAIHAHDVVEASEGSFANWFSNLFGRPG